MKVNKIAALIVGVVVLAFAVNVRNEFVRFDDFQYIVMNQAIGRGLTPHAVKWSFQSAGYASNWHPLTWMSHALDNTVADLLHLNWREKPNEKGLVVDYNGPLKRLVHIENILLHAVNAALLWWLMLVLARRHRLDEGGEPSPLPFVAAFFALLWALHPLRVEVVAWASERKELLSVLFMLLTLLAYVQDRRRAAVGWFAAALLAKPVAVTLPVLLFAYEWIVARKAFLAALRQLVAYFALSAACCVLTMLSQGEGFAGAESWTPTMRLIAVIEAPVRYLAQTFWPVGLSLDYPLPDWTGWPWFAAGGVLLLGMAGVCVWWLVKRDRWSGLAALAVAWLYVGLLPMIGVVKVGFEAHNDRYTYWIGCGAATLAFVLAARFVRLVEKQQWKPLGVVAAGVLLALSALTVRQSLIWENTESLFEDAVSKTHGEMFAQGLSEILGMTGPAGQKKGEEILRDVLDVRRTPAARGALALHLAAFGSAGAEISIMGGPAQTFREARMFAEYALEDDPNQKWAHAALAVADYRDEHFKSAYERLKKAYDLGFSSQVLPVDLKKWKAKAEEKVPGAGDGVPGAEKAKATDAKMAD